MKTKCLFLILMICFFFPGISKAEDRLPRIFSSNLVLQREQPIRFWGWASKNEKVKVNLDGKTIACKTQKEGICQVEFTRFSAGGSCTITISGETNAIVLDNVLFGDVWVSGGQSNMEFILKQAKNAELEISKANYDKIRLFKVSRDPSYSPKNDLNDGDWKLCTSINAADFSAVAYFFGKDIQSTVNVPIGLIASSCGGSGIVSWMDSKSLEVLLQNNRHFGEIKRDSEYLNYKKDSFQLVTDKWYSGFYKSSRYINRNLSHTGLQLSVVSLYPAPLKLDRQMEGLKRIEIRIPAWTIEGGKTNIKVRSSG